MLDLRGDDVIASIVPGPGDALDGGIVRLSPAAGENDLLRLTVKQSRHLRPGAFDGIARFQAVAMGTGWVAESFVEIRLHGRNHFRVERCGRVVIEINRTVSHGLYSPRLRRSNLVSLAGQSTVTVLPLTESRL